MKFSFLPWTAGMVVLAFGLAASHAKADIDSFTVAQGPLTVGPGEIPEEDQAVIEAPGVLGDFRVVAPAMGDEAPAGSTATVSVGAGQFYCEIDVSVVDPVISNGGCGVAWASGGGTAFDFSQINAIEFDVIESVGAPILALQVVDDSQTLATSFIEDVQPGPVSFPRASFFAPLSDINWSGILSVQLSVINSDGTDAVFRMGAIGSDNGQIPGTSPGPAPASDEELSNTVSGGWFSPARGGEGCQLTREGDGVTFILTCYTYIDGDQVWMIGTGQLVDGEVAVTDMVITEGASYGPLFDPDDVVLTPFGDVVMSFVDCNHAAVAMSPIVDGFGPVLLPMQKLEAIDCDAGLADPVNARRTGNWFDPNRGGEGFQLTSEGSSGLHILTFYTYIDGAPAWMIATGTIEGNRIEFNDPVLTTGTGFGTNFNPDEVSLIPFGRFIMEFSDCNNAELIADSDIAELPDQTYTLERIVPGPCS